MISLPRPLHRLPPDCVRLRRIDLDSSEGDARHDVASTLLQHVAFAEKQLFEQACIDVFGAFATETSSLLQAKDHSCRQGRIVHVRRSDLSLSTTVFWERGIQRHALICRCRYVIQSGPTRRLRHRAQRKTVHRRADHASEVRPASLVLRPTRFVAAACRASRSTQSSALRRREASVPAALNNPLSQEFAGAFGHGLKRRQCFPQL